MDVHKYNCLDWEKRALKKYFGLKLDETDIFTICDVNVWKDDFLHIIMHVIEFKSAFMMHHMSDSNY